MHLDRLRPVCESDGPFATVVLDTTHDTEDADDQDRLRWRALRHRLADQGAPNDVLTRLDDAVIDAPAAVGPAGRVLVADPQRVLVDLRTRGRPTVEAASWSVVADLSAVVEQWTEAVPLVVATVDEAGGEVGAPGEEPEALGGDRPVHKVPAGGPAHRTMQDRVEEAWRRNAVAVADAAATRVAETGARALVVAGDGPSRSRLREALPERARAIAVDVERGNVDLDEVADAVRAADRAAALDRFAQAVGRDEGFAARGLEEVVAACRASAVEVLFLAPEAVGEREVWVGAEPGAVGLTEAELVTLGSRTVGPVPAVSAVLRAAVAAGADVQLFGREDPAPDLPEGLGAVLRFPV